MDFLQTERRVQIQRDTDGRTDRDRQLDRDEYDLNTQWVLLTSNFQLLSFFLSSLPGGFLAQHWGLTWLAQCQESFTSYMQRDRQKNWEIDRETQRNTFVL